MDIANARANLFARPKLHLNITQKILLLFSGLIVFITSITSVILINGSKEVIVDQTFELKLLEEKIRAQHVFNGVERAQDYLKILSSSPAVTGIVRASRNNGIDPLDNSSLVDIKRRLQSLFAGLLLASPEYFQVRLIGVENNGKEIVRLDRIGDRVVVIQDDALQRKGNRDYFRKSIQLNPGGIYTSDINLNREHGIISQPHTPTIRIATPVFENDLTPFGILIININFGLILDNIKQSTMNGDEFYVVNERGEYLLHPDKEKTFGFDLGRDSKIQDDIKEVAPMFAGQSMPLQHRFVTAQEGADYLVQYLRLGIDQNHPDRFIGLIFKMPYAEAILGATEVRNKGVISSLLLVSAGIILSLLFCRVIVAPIKALTSTAKSISNGDYSTDFSYRSADEIGALIDAFEKMIDAIKNREVSLQEKETRYRALFANANDSIVITNSHGTIEEANPATAKIFGYAERELRGKHFSVLYPEEALDDGQGTILVDKLQGEFNAKNKSGVVVPTSISVSELVFFHGAHFSSVIRDLTQQKQALEERQKLQSQLQQIQKMDAIGQLSSGLAHDFNNVLNSIFGFTALAREKVKGPENNKVNLYLDEIYSAASHGSDIVQQLLIFSRKQDTELSMLSVDEYLEKSIKLARSMMPSSIRMKQEATRKLPMAVANSVQLQQIVLNLCINARDAINGVGEIGVATRFHSHLEGVCSSCSQHFSGEFVEISVHDSGGGIPSEDLQRIFEPFFTTKSENKGSGMGLAMIHGMMHSADGHILVESSADKGTVFRLLLTTNIEQAAQSNY